MIKPGEIQKKAREVGVRDQQIEKDYVLSWVLQGIAQHMLLSKVVVFKGGTALKKVYFKEYRFSEDLDFTLLDSAITNEQIFDWFKEIFEYVKEEANIPLEIIDDNEHEDGGINFYATYVGPLGGQGNNKNIKIDISRNEKLVFDPILKLLVVSYSDLEEYELLCYTLEEILVEKMRAVMQRMQARDFFDLWYLLEVEKMDIGFYLNEFNIKCANKALKSTDFLKKLGDRLPQYKGRWKNSLGDQIQDLPDFEQVERAVQRHLKKLKL